MDNEQHHDRFFKKVFADCGRVCRFLQGVLPKRVVPLVCWEKLSAVPVENISRDLASHYADLVFRAPVLGVGRSVFICLFEHQSSVDLHMPLRLLSYAVRIWEKHLDGGEKLPLPVIIPVVLYQVGGDGPSA